MKKRRVNCFPLLARSLLGGTHRKTQRVVNAVAMCCAVVMRRGTVPVCFEKRSVITDNAVLVLLESISDPRMLILTYVNASVAGHGFSSLACFQILMQSRTQKMQFLLRYMRPHS